MRLSNPLLLASLGALFAAASCTLITDVDRSKIPDGQAGMAPSGGGDGPIASGGEPNVPVAGSGTGATGGDPGAGGTPSSGGTPAVEGGSGGVPSNPEGGSGGAAEGGTPGTPEGGAAGGGG